MEKVIKIADLDAINKSELDNLVKAFKESEYEVIYDGEYDYRIYICIKRTCE